MGIADFAGGVSTAARQQRQDAQALEQQLAELAYQQQRNALAQAEGERATRRMTMDETQFTANQARQGRQDERQATADRQQANERGVQTMVGELIRSQGITPQNRQQIVGTLMEAGQVPSTAQILDDPEAEQRRALDLARQREDISTAGRLREIAAQGAESRRTDAARPRTASGGQGGRGVTSGDANRLADYQSAQHDLDALEQQLGTTGAASKLGTMLPNAVTEFTGLGADAKARQGTIDRVKQVIGKTLEGGVLRREDEYKYTKILPTIGDPPAVAKAKLQGLRTAIAQREQTQLDALEDAGYDTSRYRSRGGGESGGVQRWGKDANGKPVRLP